MLGFSHPEKFLLFTAISTLLVAFLSASQDIVIDAYRIENFADKEQGFALTLYTYGYRIGMLISGAFALIIAEYIGFEKTYFFLACSFLLFAVFSTLLSEKPHPHQKSSGYFDWLKKFVYAPFLDFIKTSTFFINNFLHNFI